MCVWMRHAVKSFECSNRLERYYIRTTPLIYPKHCHISGCCLDFGWAIAHGGFHDCKLSKSFDFKTSPNQYPSTTVLDSWHAVFVLYDVFVFFAKCGLGTLWSWQTFQTRHAFYKSLTFNMLTEAGSIWDAALRGFFAISLSISWSDLAVNLQAHPFLGRLHVLEYAWML